MSAFNSAVPMVMALSSDEMEHRQLYNPSAMVSKPFGTPSPNNASQPSPTPILTPNPPAPTTPADKSPMRLPGNRSLSSPIPSISSSVSSRAMSPATVAARLNDLHSHPVHRQWDRGPPSPISTRSNSSSQNLTANHLQPLRRTTTVASGTTCSSGDSSTKDPGIRIRAGGGRSGAIVTQKSSKGMKKLATAQSQSQSQPRVSSAAAHRRDGSMSLDSIIASGVLSDNSATSSISDVSAGPVRVVGRGGAASRPRVVVTKGLETIPANGPLLSPPRSKPLSPPKPEPVQLSSPQPPAQAAQTFYRPMGRGGMGSRPKAKAPSSTTSSPQPAILSLLKVRKASKKDLKGKNKAPDSPLPIHPINPTLAHDIMKDDGSSMVSSIHFLGETGEMPNFFPTNNSLRSAGPSSPSAASSSFRSVSPSILSRESDLESVTTEDHRVRNYNKLARTLGDYPTEEIYSVGDRSGTSTPSLLYDRSAKMSRRASLSLSSISSVFVRPTPRHKKRDSLASHHSMSTLTSDELHQHGLTDQASEMWAERDSMYCVESPGSPIMFSPPSPVVFSKPENPVNPRHGLPSTAANTPSLYEDESSPTTPTRAFVHEIDLSMPTTPLSTSMITRSATYSIAARVRESNAPSAYGRSTPASFVSDETAFAPPNSPDAGKYADDVWFVPPSFEETPTAFLVSGYDEDARKPQMYTGEWNTDMQEVIRALRELR